MPYSGRLGSKNEERTLESIRSLTGRQQAWWKHGQPAIFTWSLCESVLFIWSMSPFNENCLALCTAKVNTSMYVPLLYLFNPASFVGFFIFSFDPMLS